MVIMALDHVRDFIHAPALIHDPLDLATTTPLLFFTRWITHFCAPVFVMLSGVSISLQSQRKSRKELSSFLLKRGLWLIVVEMIVVTFAWTFNPCYNLVILQVIWVIGISMVILGLLIWLPYNILLWMGLIIVFGHDALDYSSALQNPHAGFWWDLLKKGNFAVHCILPDHCLLIIYPFLPWLGLMILGYCLGKIYQAGISITRRLNFLYSLGAGLVLLFILLRSLNIYGDPHVWTPQKNFLFSLLSFLNVSKYPPSLLFICITIGPSLILLAFLERFNNRFTRALTDFGRVPFFYYVLHLYLFHAISMILFFTRGHTFSEGMNAKPQVPFRFFTPGEGYDLWVVYFIWIAVVIALYPLCKWFNDYKGRHKKWWLSYL